MNTIIQRDSHDKDMFLVKHNCRNNVAPRFLLDFIIHIDCLHDLVDDLTYQAIEELAPGEILGIIFILKLTEG